MERQNGRPADCAGRLEKEIRCYDLLDKLDIPYQRIDHEPANTMEACAATDEALQATICKNLLLDITPGSVSVLGLMNDKENKVQLLIDEDVLKGEYFGCHPCINTSSLRLKTADLMERIIPAMGHEYRTVTI